MSDVSEQAMRIAVVEAAQALFRNQVMSHTGHANLSVRVAPEEMLLTVDGMVRDLTPERMARVHLDGRVQSGDLDPTNAEIVAMHAEVYRARDDVGGIIHTHSPNLLAFAMANRVLPCRYEALLRFGQAVPVPVVPWAPRGSERSVGGIIEAIRQHPGTQAVLLGNHGVLAFAASPQAAAALVTVLEEAAQAELAAEDLGGAQDFPPGALDEVRRAMARVR
ncbi:MAG: class II aldolase/adducin family protein [Candidatus Dormibacteraeota bacterium]|jgi:L-fuculose-phosphate aldolase|nr:class II aldolase/adducin family protein [Candidatus Dormibacteraeota bacterium]